MTYGVCVSVSVNELEEEAAAFAAIPPALVRGVCVPVTVNDTFIRVTRFIHM